MIQNTDANKIRQFTQKLETQGDITLKEADEIYSLFSDNAIYTALNPISPKFNEKLSKALKDWYEVVAQKIKEGRRGNFIFTVIFSEHTYIDKLLLPAHQAIKEHGTFDILYDVLMVDEKIYSSLPFKHLFIKVNNSQLKPYYEIKSNRAGILRYPVEVDGNTYTASELIKRLSPVITLGSPEDANLALSMAAFNVALGAHEVVEKLFIFGKYEVKLFTLTAFMRYEDIPCAAAVDAYNGKFTIFTEKDKALIVKHALEVSFEELAQNAVKEKVFDKQMAKELINDYPIVNFPMKNFAEASAKYIDGIVQKRLEWQTERRRVEYEPEWLEETR